MDRPSGDHAAPVFRPGLCETRRARPPPADTIQRSGLLRAYDVNATSAPPGEYAGSRLSEPIFVSTAMRPPSMSTEPISCELWPLMANTMREPNTPRLVVVDCTMSFANSWTASRTSE